MELIKKGLPGRIKHLGNKISEDRLFLLSAAISYYSALALAPFLLILLWIASILGQNVQAQIIQHAHLNFSPQVADMVEMVFGNINQGVSLGSISGIVGFSVLLFTCSLVFLQFRHALDVIYGYYNHKFSRSLWHFLKEKLFAMLAVFGGIFLLIMSFAAAAMVEYLWGPDETGREVYRYLVVLLNFCIYLVLFTGLYMFTPSRKQRFKNALEIAAFTSICFMIGNVLLVSYLKQVARDSVYGAAGTLLVFLIWSYYSSFIIFLSVEIFLYLKRWRKIMS